MTQAFLALVFNKVNSENKTRQQHTQKSAISFLSWNKKPVSYKNQGTYIFLAVRDDF